MRHGLFGWLLLLKFQERTLIFNWSVQLQFLCSCLIQGAFTQAPKVNWPKVGWTLNYSLVSGKHFCVCVWWFWYELLTIPCILLLYLFLLEKKNFRILTNLPINTQLINSSLGILKTFMYNVQRKSLSCIRFLVFI